ncbi:TlpA disulfide reductase family protein [Maribacter polysaccharolyticus]|uniref:TlpA disulfide reductase family protein n=1 Tax=Maribacter polysaccharolyticus TaxID=3020831 RepID=UPI00237F2441|nr:TlpA disulfide reductase family protein [Maribacter polysaccharolyticus]MDE3742776.1 TlpA disulfide reductase family protein [Maribacter polysaccharolyticus]
MHKLFLLLVLFAFTGSCKRQVNTEGYTISGNVKNLDNVYIKLKEGGFRDRSKIKTIDSVKIANGKFEFKGKVDHPDMVNLVVESKFQAQFIIENSDIKIDIDVTRKKEKSPYFKFEVTGSNSNELYQKADAACLAVFKDAKYSQLDTLKALFVKAKKDTSYLEKAQKLKVELSPLTKERSERYKNKKYDFVRNNPEDPASVYILGYFYSEVRMTAEELEEFYNLFKGDARKTNFFISHISKIYKNYFEKLGVGSIAPDFTLNNLEGQPVRLSKINAKYKLVDFWASWCIPCRKSFPHLKELREKYKNDGFEIIGIATSDGEDKWRKAIEEDQTPWLHVFDATNTSKGTANANKGDVSTNYGVSFLPTSFLMDNNEKIILRNPSKEELDMKLKELFGY